MTIRLVDKNWSKELQNAMKISSDRFYIISPFIKLGAIEQLLKKKIEHIRVITRFNESDFAQNVSDIEALRSLLNAGAKVRGARNLHAKLYLFGNSRAIITSANLTKAGLDHNHELGIVGDGPELISNCQSYFDTLWEKLPPDLKKDDLDKWNKNIREYQIKAEPNYSVCLKDHGIEIDLEIDLTPEFEAQQAFIKFIGNSNERYEHSISTIDDLDKSGCHCAVAYRKDDKRLHSIQRNAVIFFGRLTKNPNGITIYGYGLALRHHQGKDNATPREIKRDAWRSTYRYNIRIHHPHFVNGTLANGVSLRSLVQDLGVESYVSTQRKARAGQGGNDPMKAHCRQPHIELSQEGFLWLRDKLQKAFDQYGEIPYRDLRDKLNWP